MIRIYCDRHATRIGTSDGMTLRLKHGAFPDGRVQVDLCPDCALEFRTWLGDRAATLPEAVESPVSSSNGVPSGPTRRGSRTTIG